MLHFLYTHRTVSRTLSRDWFRLWAKRIINFPYLMKASFIQRRLKLSGAKIGNLSLILCSTVIKNSHKLTVGDHTYIDKGASLSLHDRVTIGNNVAINSGARIFTGSHDIDSPFWPLVTKPVTIGDHVWIASNSILLPGVSLGMGCVVAAGSVVTRSFPPNCIIAGNPGRAIKMRQDTQFEYSPTAFVSFFECWIGSNFRLHPL